MSEANLPELPSDFPNLPSDFEAQPGQAGMGQEAEISAPTAPEPSFLPQPNTGAESLAPFEAESGHGPERSLEDEETAMRQKIEELSESLIDEKWQDVSKEMGNLADWRSEVENKVGNLEQRFNDLTQRIDSLEQSIVAKVEDYDKSIKDVGSEIQALEQFFQKIIPTLSQDVNELSRITKSMKAGKHTAHTTHHTTHAGHAHHRK